jgi:hypothetical protein
MDLQTIIKKAHSEWKQNPSHAVNELEVISKYSYLFNPKNIDNLTAANYKSFLNFRNNKHLTGLSISVAQYSLHHECLAPIKERIYTDLDLI